jgi:hypothetical protein
MWTLLLTSLPIASVFFDPRAAFRMKSMLDWRCMGRRVTDEPFVVSPSTPSSVMVDLRRSSLARARTISINFTRVWRTE